MAITTSPDPKKKGRSRVSNGTQLFLDSIEGDQKLARRFRDIVAEVISDLGGGAGLSEGQRQLVRRIAALSVECERQELRMAQGEEVDFNAYATLSNALRRLLETVGLKREARDATQTIDEYIATLSTKKERRG